MEINRSTKILPLIDKYQKVYDELYKLSSKTKRFKNPIVRKTIGKKSTIEMASGILEIPIETIITIIKSVIEVSVEEPPEKNRKEMMKNLLIDMHKGVDIKILSSLKIPWVNDRREFAFLCPFFPGFPIGLEML